MTTTTPSKWAMGWSAFAAIALIMLGTFQAISGLVALFEDTFYVVTTEWIFEFDVTTWGWIHLIGGIILLLSGFGIFTGNLAARVVGVIVAVLSAVANFAWLPYYPIWSIIMITLAIGVIWALTAHGRDLAV
ncbi:MAG: DUF7144 family membrane protein [Acidimicrobiales bacterium]